MNGKDGKPFKTRDGGVMTLESLLTLAEEKFPENPDMLREQLNSYGINFDESNITFEQLKYLCENIYGDIEKRGTSGIFDRKGKVLPNLEEMPVDGELVRLLKSTEADELIYEIIPNNKVGWCLGQCSPLYKGTCENFHE